MIEQVESSALSALLEKFSPAIAAGSAVVVSVASIRERFGNRWPRKHEQVDAFVKRTIVRLAGASASFEALNDVEFIIVQPNVEPLVLLNFAAGVLKETLTFFLGEAKAENIRIFKVEGWANGALTLSPVRVEQSRENEVDTVVLDEARVGSFGPKTAHPSLQALSYARTESVTLAIEGERPLAVSYAIEAVWNVNQRVVTSYAMIPQVSLEATGEPLDLSAVSRGAALRLAVEALDQASTMIQEGAARGARFAVHVPVPVQGIMSVRGRYVLLRTLYNYSASARKLLALDLCCHAEGLPYSRMCELVTALAPACRAVLANALPSDFKVKEWQGCRLSGVSLNCAHLDPSDAQSLARLVFFAQDAGDVSKTVIAHSLPNRSLALGALAAGFSHLSGQPIRPILDQPNAVRWTLGDLYREAGERAPSQKPPAPSPRTVAPAPATSSAGDPDLRPWLSAMDGVVYLVDSDAVIVGAGGAGWWTANEGAHAGQVPAPEAVIGLNLFQQISGEAVRDHYQAAHTWVMEQRRAQIMFEYRCDAPDIKRTMRMSIGRLSRPGHKPLAIYQSQILSAVHRPWMTVFESSRILEAYKAESSLPIITACSICERIAWPRAATSEGEWIEAEAYYSRGGGSDVRVSHTVCGPCGQAFASLLTA